MNNALLYFLVFLFLLVLVSFILFCFTERRYNKFHSEALRLLNKRHLDSAKTVIKYLPEEANLLKRQKWCDLRRNFLKYLSSESIKIRLASARGLVSKNDNPKLARFVLSQLVRDMYEAKECHYSLHYKDVKECLRMYISQIKKDIQDERHFSEFEWEVTLPEDLVMMDSLGICALQDLYALIDRINQERLRDTERSGLPENSLCLEGG